MCTYSLGTIMRQQNVELGPFFAFCAYQTVATMGREAWYHEKLYWNSFFTHNFFYFITILKLVSSLNKIIFCLSHYLFSICKLESVCVYVCMLRVCVLSLVLR